MIIIIILDSLLRVQGTNNCLSGCGLAAVQVGCMHTTDTRQHVFLEKNKQGAFFFFEKNPEPIGKGGRPKQNIPC